MKHNSNGCHRPDKTVFCEIFSALYNWSGKRRS